MKRHSWLSVWILAAAVPMQAGDASYSWPALPDQTVLQKQLGFKSETGLLVLERNVRLELEAFKGITREEFVRILVQNEKGVQNASLQINERTDSRVEKVEGRTVRPDGTALPLDSAKDVHKTEVATLKKRAPLVSVARVDFPAPSRGCILDLHFVTQYEGGVFFFSDLVPFAQSPTLKTDYSIKVGGGFPGTMWSATVLGGGSGGGRIEQKSGNTIEVHYGPVVPGKAEPLSPPFYHREATVLVYLKWALLDFNSEKVAEQIMLDSRGRSTTVNYESEPIRKWWKKYVDEDESACRNFIRRPGRAKDLDVNAIAPPSLSLEERLRLLYDATQESIGFNPDADRNMDLSDAMRAGQNHTYQGTLLFSYLLEQARIPHQRVLIANRYMIRYSPLIMNGWLYGFTNAVRVELPKGEVRYFQPGQKDLPFGCLPPEYQDSLALWMEKAADRPSHEFTPLNRLETDRRHISFDLAVDERGDASGELVLSDIGSGAVGFRSWYRNRAFRLAHPKREDKKKALTPEEEAALLRRRMREVCVIPAVDAVLGEPRLDSFPKFSREPLRIAAPVTVKALARQGGANRWLLASFPLAAGYESPFKEEARQTPVWYEECGTMVQEGYVILPPGARILDVPPPIRWEGPEGAYFAAKVEAGERDGKPALSSRVEWGVPATLGRDSYPALRTFESELASAMGAKCVVEWAEARVLE